MMNSKQLEIKQIVLIGLTVLALQSCQSEDYRDIRKEVLLAHDVVMKDDEIAYRNKMRLDTFLSRLDSLHGVKVISDTLKEKVLINDLLKQLNYTDGQMRDWMHNFDAELGKKSNKEAVDYFKSEKAKISRLDSLYKLAISGSNAYLAKFAKQ